MRFRLPLLVSVAVVASLSACGGDDDGDADGIASLGTTPTTTVSTVPTTTAVDDDAASAVPGPSAPDGSATDEGTEPPSTDLEEAMLDYTACMRDHGIDMPDPQFGEAGEFTMSVGVDGGEGPTPEEFEAAEDACGHLMEAARREIDIDPEEQAAMQERMLEFAQCMREHGIDMPDPQFDDDGGVSIQIAEADGDNRPPPSDEEVREANEACRQDDEMMMAAPALAPAGGD